jgi:8-oxo-dGTP diphosphatase
VSRDDRFLAPEELAGRYKDVYRRRTTEMLAPERWDDAHSRTEQSQWGVGGFVTREGSLLLIRQGQRWNGSEPWIAPGGMLEAGETHADGAKREIREETGLVVEIDGLAAINEQQFVNATNDRRFRFCFAMFDATPRTTELAADPGLASENIRAVEWFESLPDLR